MYTQKPGCAIPDPYFTSANFSVSAEQHNVELGIRIDSRAITETVEEQLIEAQTTLYERVN